MKKPIKSKSGSIFIKTFVITVSGLALIAIGFLGAMYLFG